MPLNLHLELQINNYYIFCCVVTHTLAVAVIFFLRLELWMYIVLLNSIVASLLWYLTKDRVKQVHLYFDASRQLQIVLIEQAKPVIKWQLLWRNRQLVILQLAIPGKFLPITLWISPHSLRQPEQHRYLRIICGFFRSSKMNPQDNPWQLRSD